MRYAEEQQDLALLSISTFQRALKVSDYEIVFYAEFWVAITKVKRS